MAANALWTGTTQRSVTDLVPAPPETVRAFYVDLDNIALVHPLVISVQSTGRTVQPATQDGGEDSYVQEYCVRDRIPIGRFALHIRYAVRLSVPATGDVIAESRQFPGVRLHTTVSFAPTDDSGRATRVTERMQIRAPRPLLAMTVNEAVAAHATMLAGIARHFS